MQQGKNVKERPPGNAGSGIKESEERLSPEPLASGGENALASSGRMGDADGIEQWASAGLDEGQASHESPYLTMFTKNVTESGSFQIPSDWLEPMWNILQALPVPALLVDRSHRIAFANVACRQVVNLYEDLHGKAFSSLFSESGDAREADRIAEEVYTATKPQTMHARVFSGKKPIWARLHYRALRIVQDRFVLVLIDDLTAEKEKLELIEKHREELLEARTELDRSNAQLRREMEERQKAQAKIEHAKREWERTFDAVPDLISIVDKDHRIVRVNKAMAERLGKSYDEILGTQCFWGAHSAEDPIAQCPHIKLMRDGQPHRAELTEKHLGGVFDISVSPLHDEQGQLIGSVHVARDVTDVKKAQQLLLESGRARVVAELAGMVAHSFNNLLQTAMGGAQLSLTNLELGNFSDLKNTLEEIVEDLRRGARTVRRLNFLARAYAQPSLFENRVLDFSAAVHQALDMCSPWWKTLPEQAGIRITLKRDLGPDCIVKGDQDELLEVVVELVKNAAEALPEGGTIEVSTCFEGKWVALKVRDDGVGIPREDHGKVFQPLWTTKGPASAGMGLERVTSTVKRHGGKTMLESDIGRGTTVTVLLPREQVQEQDARSAILEEPGPTRRILLVDDMEPVLRMLARSLEQVGHKVFPCLSGSRALELFKASPFDLVISDLGMPDMNGWQVAETLSGLAQERQQPRTPFILLTGWGGQTGKEEMIAKCGVDAVLEKPIDMAELTRVIRRLTGQV